MRFLPKSRASMDQAPGPTIAKTAPRTACMMAIHGSPECEKYREKAIHTLTMAASVPATGVHKPTRRSIPAPIPMICRTTIVNGGASQQAGDPKMDQRSGRKQPQEQKTYAGPTIAKRRE